MSIPSWAVKGAKVVCIDAGRHNGHVAPMLVKGSTYTVSYVGFSRTDPDIAVFRLREAQLPPGRSGFQISRFRPLVTRTREHDIAIFAPLLNITSVDA